MKRLFFIVLCVFLFPHECLPQCTSFCLTSGDTVLFGNTLDWSTGDGLIVVNKRNVSKTAFGVSNPVKWTSKYGSVSFNQWGREFPCRGMNEAGLAIGEMSLSETKFPKPDSRPSFSLEQWIQYQLDNCATVEEVIATDLIVRLDTSAYTSHFFVADSSGNCVAMEWLNGKLVYHTRESLPHKVITNSTYNSLVEFYAKKTPHAVNDYCSLARFSRVANMMENYNPSLNGPAKEYAWSILQSVRNPEWTKWLILFDVSNRWLYYKTNMNSEVHFIEMKSLDFACSTPVKILDVYVNVSGDVQKYLVDYNYEANFSLIDKMTKLLGQITGVPSESFIENTARYPATTVCSEGK